MKEIEEKQHELVKELKQLRATFKVCTCIYVLTFKIYHYNKN